MLLARLWISLFCTYFFTSVVFASAEIEMPQAQALGVETRARAAKRIFAPSREAELPPSASKRRKATFYVYPSLPSLKKPIPGKRRIYLPKGVKAKNGKPPVAGSGAYGLVIKALKFDGQDVVAKVVSSDPNGSEALENIREVMVNTSSLMHPNIVRCFTASCRAVSKGERYDSTLIFEEMDLSLYHLLAKYKITVPHAKLILSKILRGLAYLHSGGLIHRDIKSQNVFVNKNDLVQLEVKIGDFGATIPGNSMYAFSGYQYITTPNYRAPEIFKKEAYGRKIDIWGVGCIFYELLTQKLLFSGQTDAEVLHEMNKFSQNREPILAEIRAKAGDHAANLFYGLTRIQYEKRLTAKEALAQDFFRDLPDYSEPIQEMDDDTKARLHENLYFDRIPMVELNPGHKDWLTSHQAFTRGFFNQWSQESEEEALE